MSTALSSSPSVVRLLVSNIPKNNPLCFSLILNPMRSDSITTVTVVVFSDHSLAMQGKLKYRETVTEGFDNMWSKHFCVLY